MADGRCPDMSAVDILKRLSNVQNRYGANADSCAYWRNLANTIEPSIRGADAAFCQITLTTCYYYYMSSGA